MIKNLRILTWNCCHGNCTERLTRVDHLKSDVTILTESLESDVGYRNLKWAKVYKRRGITVRVSNRFSINRLGPDKPLHPCVHGYQISGPISFDLLACWSHPLDSRDQDYRDPWVSGIAAYEDYLTGRPLIIAGDFNDNPRWDKDYSKPFSFEFRLGGFCKQYALVSAYHKFFKQSHGSETRFTHFNNRIGKSYHIDYVLVPEVWRIRKVTIERPIFDHNPMVVTVAV